MARQFDKVNNSYGAPMGRATWPGRPEQKHSVRLFRVKLDSAGYDDGGAYWGIGAPLYCATDGESYREFIRADNRAHAIALLRLPAWLMRAGCHEYNQLRALEEYGNATAQSVALRQQLDRLGYGDRHALVV